MANSFTYKASEYVNDPTFRSMWLDARSNNKIKVIIDNIEIPSYSDYTYIDVKSYFKEPERSAKGVINNLNSYATFLTPKLKFSFNSMPISAYRVLMKLIKERNEFIVQAYDPVEDIVVVRKMYFYPKDYPQIYTQGYEALRINNEEFELTGTNANLDLYSLVYDSNVTSTSGGSTSNITTGLTFYYGQEITIGDYDTDIGIDPTTFENAGFTFDKWNTARDGSGLTYLTGQSSIQFTTNTTLYAMWKSNTKFSVSFDYQAGSDYSGETTTTKEVIQGEAYGTLPTDLHKDGYIFGGWFTQMNGVGTQITQDTIFNKTYNETLYAYWIGASATIKFDNNGGTGSINQIDSMTGEEVTLPLNTTITKNGYQFMGWGTSGTSTTIYINDGGKLIVPANGITLYAIWKQTFLLTYNVNDSYGTIYQSNVAQENKPVYVSRIGYKLIGWYSNAELTNFVTFPLVITENTNLYAKWEKIETGE